MKLLHQIRASARKLFHPEVAPAQAYDWWAPTYDQQPGNLMLALDEQIFAGLLSHIPCSGKIVVDFGCGTGRHWDHLLAQKPFKVIGYDVSPLMLQRLREKYPLAQTHLLAGGQLPYDEVRPAGVLITTLALAHVEKPLTVMEQWNKILQPGADILLTDYHPETLALGGDRTFPYQGKTIAIRNYVHPLEQVLQFARANGFELRELVERRIGPELKPWYEKKGALGVYQKFLGAGIIYGMHLRKSDGVS